MDTLFFFDYLELQLNITPLLKQENYSKYLPLLSPIIVIITFVFNNMYTVRTKKAESRRSWYFKAYLEPYMKKVEIFFNNADEQMKNALLELDSFSESEEEYINFIGNELYKLANSKRKFEIEVVKILQATYPEISSSLESSLMNFEDAGVKAFEKNAIDPYYTYIDEINIIKNSLIKALSVPALGV